MTEQHTVITRAGLLDGLQELQAVLRDYAAVMDDVCDRLPLDASALAALKRHRARAVAEDSPFARIGALSALFAHVLERVPADELTFRLPVRGGEVPLAEDAELAALCAELRGVRAGLDELVDALRPLLGSRAAIGNARAQALLAATTALFKGVLRQDWRDVELVLDHLNLVTTTRHNHELVEQVARIARHIYDCLQEVGSACDSTEALSDSTRHIPDAVDKLNSVIGELEAHANRNLDVLEQLTNAAREDRKQVAHVQGVLAGCDEELEALGQAHPALAEALAPVRERIGEEAVAPLQAYDERLAANSEAYMTLFSHQSYQDLTGQTLGKVIAFIESLQYQLVQLITHGKTDPAAPDTGEAGAPEQGPDAGGRLSQERVDKLLAEMGF